MTLLAKSQMGAISVSTAFIPSLAGSGGLGRLQLAVAKGISLTVGGAGTPRCSHISIREKAVFLGKLCCVGC